MAFYKEKRQRDFRLRTSAADPSALDFTKLKIGKQYLNGEIATIIKDSRSSNTRAFSREKIEQAITRHDTKELRRISNYFFETSGIYSRLCRYMAYLYRYD